LSAVQKHELIVNDAGSTGYVLVYTYIPRKSCPLLLATRFPVDSNLWIGLLPGNWASFFLVFDIF